MNAHTLPPDRLGQAESAEVVERVRLAMVAGVGPRLNAALLERFHTAAAVFASAPSDLCEVPGIGAKLAQRIAAGHAEIDAVGEIEAAQRQGVELVLAGTEAYPKLLAEIHDPPAVLFVRGEILPRDSLAVAIVGTRHASQYGRNQARRLAAGLAARGICVVSGMARGIDGEAHRAALEAGGRTIAVLGGGVLRVYPPEHTELATQIAGQGAVISETPPRMPPVAGSFPQRNRIVSGLSAGVIVVEAAERSGALITARLAMEQGREVFAVPGRVDSRQARGCHRLIRDGACLVETVDDVLAELGPLFEATQLENGDTIRNPVELQLNEVESAILQSISAQPTSIDVIVRATGIPVHRVLATISVLEVRHVIRRISGNTVARV